MLASHRRFKAPTEFTCGIGLLCHNPALSLVCFTPYLIETWRPEETSDGRQRQGGWRLGLLATTGGAMSILPSCPNLAFLTPAFALATLPAFAEMPLLAYTLFVPLLLDNIAAFWPVFLVLLGMGLGLCLRVERTLDFSPLFLLGLTLCARAGDLPDSALAGSEAMLLALALNGLSSRLTLFRAPLPPLAGFMPFWLGLHVVNALSTLSPVWTAASMTLSVLIGLWIVRAWLASWQSLSKELSTIQTSAGRGWVEFNYGTADLNPAHKFFASLALGLCLSICPGLLIGLFHGAALHISGAPQDTWGAWPIWSIPGGDGAFWHPALIFSIPMLAISPIITRMPPLRATLSQWPDPDLKPCIPWALRRIIVSARRKILPLHQGARKLTSRYSHSLPQPSGHPLDTVLPRHALTLWLMVLIAALAWLSWTA